MGALRKIGLVILAYVILGVIFTVLLLNGIIIRNDGNILVDIFYWVLLPIILITNLLYATVPFLH
ncbi:MAG: hypothetical protein E4H14_11525 [Candidatus Thorarchaeota archaeon]|nr:MAG: hypothetical protein E4H14_11525 [Candidatus Thorarchaeota archaeon]